MKLTGLIAAPHTPFHGDFSLNLVFVYRITKGSDILGTQTSINMAILKRFNAEGLEMAFPSQTIYNKQI